jgi:hypothetical protein
MSCGRKTKNKFQILNSNFFVFRKNLHKKSKKIIISSQSHYFLIPTHKTAFILIVHFQFHFYFISTCIILQNFKKLILWFQIFCLFFVYFLFIFCQFFFFFHYFCCLSLFLNMNVSISPPLSFSPINQPTLDLTINPNT